MRCFAIFTLAFLLMFSFVACGDDDDDSSSNAEPTDDDAVADDDQVDDDQADDDQSDDDNTDDDQTDDDTANECWTDLTVGDAMIFAQGFGGTEGIGFNSLGEMYVSADTAVARVYPDGTWEELVDFIDPIGLAFSPTDEMFVCEFGANNLPGTNDGAVYRLDTAMNKALLANGIENPNFITYTPQGTFLVSDNYTTTIYEVTTEGALSEWLTGIDSPNGMVYSADHQALYVAGTFTSGAPVYRVDLDQNGDPTSFDTIANLDTLGLPDGIALDENGMLYVTENALGRVVRVDPVTGDYEQLASGIVTAASIAFGKGPNFDPCSIYVTELMGPKIWRIAVGVHGNPLVNEE